jgi:hypothetical protein
VTVAHRTPGSFIVGLVKVVRTAKLPSRLDEVFGRHGGGWYMISGKQLLLVGPALTVEKSLTICRNGTAAASPGGKLLAIPGTDTLALKARAAAKTSRPDAGCG